ncbi:unnamed protein product [Porites lobata]|uniref:Uncharacterized protein n=1 Tax=Porites lobata TaxID=104759 RepID=A0ABN8P0R9_9CNID|nr:unnamed protein product [Porites lobata]
MIMNLDRHYLVCPSKYFLVIPISTPLLPVGINASLRCCGHIGKQEDPGDKVVSVLAMAEVPNSRSVPSGHDEQFVVQPDEDLHCIICSLPSKEPVLTRCGHRFCRQCLEEFLRRQEQEGHQITCPLDREALERNKDIFPDKLAERKVLSHVIKCPNECCDWRGELREKENHLASCPWKIVSCTNEKCGEHLARKDLTEHVANTCVWRILRCLYCQEHHPQCQMEAHLENCEGLLTACPNDCGIKITIEKVSDHVENTCPLTEVPCPYNWLGCFLKIQREVLESHLQSETRYHLHLSCCKLNDTKNEVRNLQLEVEKLQGQEDNHHNEIERRAQALQYQFQERAQALQNQFEERVQALQNHFEDREQVLQNHFEDRLHAFQNHFEDRVQALENHFEERINLLTVTINRLRKNLKFTSIVFAVTVVILAALNGMSNRESAVLNRLEKNIMRNVEEQRKLEMKMDEAQKYLAAMSLNMSDQESAKSDEANNYFEVVSLNMSNHESAVRDFKTKMESRVTDVRTKLEGKLDEATKSLKEKLNERLSVVTLLKENLSRTAPMRGEHYQEFLGDARPFSPVLLDFIKVIRWFKTVMQQAGIDITKFKPHSTRATSTSGAKRNAVPLENILTAAGWKRDCTDLLIVDSSSYKQKIREFETKIQALATRLDSPRVVCDEKATDGDERTDWSSIMYLNQQNVECPQGLFLASFQLKTKAYGILVKQRHRVSYHYHCCKFIL